MPFFISLQEVLIVGIGKHVLRIDTTKVRKGVSYTVAEEPLKCPIDNPIHGVQHVGKHEGEVTDLSMCHWMTTRLVSASTDGMVCFCRYSLACFGLKRFMIYKTFLRYRIRIFQCAVDPIFILY